MKTRVEPNKYGKHNLFSVFEVLENDVISEKPIVSFGVKKAKAILKHMEELKQFIKENE